MSMRDQSGNFLAVHAVGATPVLVDLDAENWNLNPGRLAEAPQWRSPLVVMDIDGVLDKQIFGFPSTTAAGVVPSTPWLLSA